MVKRYDRKVSLTYQDTNSLIYKIETGDVYKDISENKINEYFNFKKAFII